MIGALSNSAKELRAVEDGYRESAEIWKAVLRERRAKQIAMTTQARGKSVCGTVPKKGLSGRYVPTRCETGPFRRRWKHRGPIPTKTLQR